MIAVCLTAQLDRELLHWFNNSHSLFVDGVAFSLTQGYTWIPLYVALLYIVVRNNETMAQIALAVACVGGAVLFADAVTDGLVKPWVGRWRPSNDPIWKYTIDIVNNVRGDKYSFFSAHAANTMTVATFMSLMIRNGRFALFMICWSLVNAWTRLYLGLHYPSDIAVGLVWGMCTGALAYYFYYRIYRKISSPLHYISSKYTVTGYSLDDLDVVYLVMSLTVFYALFRAVLFPFS